MTSDDGAGVSMDISNSTLAYTLSPEQIRTGTPQSLFRQYTAPVNTRHPTMPSGLLANTIKHRSHWHRPNKVLWLAQSTISECWDQQNWNTSAPPVRQISNFEMPENKVMVLVTAPSYSMQTKSAELSVAPLISSRNTKIKPPRSL